MKSARSAIEREPTEHNGKAAAWLALAQGIYTAGTGIWPLLDIESFEKVTGPKEDDWLVKTAGLLFTLSGTILIGSAVAGAITKREIPKETIALGVGTAAAATTIDVIYTAKRRISPIYLLDALVELPILLGWFRSLRHGNGRREHDRPSPGRR